MQIELRYFRQWAAAVGIVALCSAAMPALAQNFSGDARSIGLETAGEETNFASPLVNDTRPYTSIVLPLGLIQVFKNTNIYDPVKTHSTRFV
jgi:hypothetical protein